MAATPLDIASLSIVVLLGGVLLPVLFHKRQGILIGVSFVFSAAASLLMAGAGAWTVAQGLTNRTVLGIGLPDLPFHLRLDPLSGFFLVVIGLLSLFVSIYSMGYVRGYLGHRSITRLVVFHALFLVGMEMVVLADDALFFLISWEVMAAASYFLVMFEDESVANRRAAFLYMVVAHVGAMAILLSFGVMAGLATGFDTFEGFTFDAMREARFSSTWATTAFLLAFFGFAAKAGVVPLHAWLPEAHPAAPSNISALMSGVMLKTAIYGMIRVVFDLIRVFPWWWGAIVLGFGLLSAVMGILYALMQHDLKRLLAFSSVENIGVILIGLGLAMIFTSFQLPVMAALALIACLYHVMNHALFKGLLFMGAGAVLHATGERNMNRLGGLIHKMPWTSGLFLVGCLSISALPPLNGFVSEWLIFQAFLLSPSLPSPLIKLMLPLSAALLALAASLAAVAFVKVFGVTFLGHWRGHRDAHVHEVGGFMRLGMFLAALSCLVLGVLPPVFISWMDVLAEQLVGTQLGPTASTGGWLWLTPVAPDRASYSGIIVFLGILAVYGAVYLLLHVKPRSVHRGPIWDCGFEKLTDRMQYNATSFSMPIRRIFGFLFGIREIVQLAPQAGHPAFPKRLVYRLKVRDRLWGWIYKPVSEASFWVSRKVGRLQQGRIQSYLIYSFVTIIFLLLFVR